MTRIIIWLSLLGSLSLTAQSNNYSIDVGHTYIGFDVERFMVGEVSGRFNDFTAEVWLEEEDLSSLQVEAIIQVKSIDSNHEIRDGHLLGEIWLHEEVYPEIRFKSNQLEQTEEGEFMMTGDLTIKGVTHAISFPIEILGPFTDPTDHKTIGLKADLIIDRLDYGITLDRNMENGFPFIGKEVKIKIRALVQQN